MPMISEDLYARAAARAGALGQDVEAYLTNLVTSDERAVIEERLRRHRAAHDELRAMAGVLPEVPVPVFAADDEWRHYR